MSGSCSSCYNLYLHFLGSKIITRGSIELTQVRKWEMAHNRVFAMFGFRRVGVINFSHISHRSRTHPSFSEAVMFSRLNTVALPGAPSFQSNNLSGHGDLLCFVRLTEVSIVQDEKFNKIALSRSQISEVT